MSQRIREIEHPQGRYLPDSSVCLCFPVRTILWKLLTFVLCEAHAVWVNTGLLPSATISVNNGKPLDLKSYKLLSVLRKLNYECLQNTAGVQATAQTIDTCSQSWQLIIPPWMRIKRTLSSSPALIWWMISWENSRAFFAFWNPPPAPRAYTQKHTFNTSISCAQAQRWDRYVHTYLHKFPRWSRKHQTSGSMFDSDKNKVCREDCISVLFSYLDGVKMASQQRSLLLRWQCQRFFVHVFWVVGGDGGVALLDDDDTPLNGFPLDNCFLKEQKKRGEPSVSKLEVKQ